MSITFPNLADRDMTVLDRYLKHEFYEPAAEDVDNPSRSLRN